MASEPQMTDGPNTHRFPGYPYTTIHVFSLTRIDGIEHHFHVPAELVAVIDASRPEATTSPEPARSGAGTCPSCGHRAHGEEVCDAERAGMLTGCPCTPTSPEPDTERDWLIGLASKMGDHLFHPETHASPDPTSSSGGDGCWTDLYRAIVGLDKPPASKTDTDEREHRCLDCHAKCGEHVCG